MQRERLKRWLAPARRATHEPRWAARAACLAGLEQLVEGARRERASAARRRRALAFTVAAGAASLVTGGAVGVIWFLTARCAVCGAVHAWAAAPWSRAFAAAAAFVVVAALVGWRRAARAPLARDDRGRAPG